MKYKCIWCGLEHNTREDIGKYIVKMNYKNETLYFCNQICLTLLKKNLARCNKAIE